MNKGNPFIKRFLISIFSIMLLTGSFNISILNVRADEPVDDGMTYTVQTYVNAADPDGDIVYEPHTEPEPEQEDPTLFKLAPYYTSVEDAAVALRTGFCNHDERISIPVSISSEGYADWKDLQKAICAEAMKITDVSTEGDYIAGNILKYDTWTPDVEVEDGCYSGTIYYKDIYYYSTLEQEAEVNETLPGIKSEIESNYSTAMTTAGFNPDDKSDDNEVWQYYMTKSIYDYMTKNVQYDDDHLPDTNYRAMFSAYSAIVTKKTVCNGYSLMFYRIATEEGIEARYIQGTAYSIDGESGDRIEPEGHAWNMVNIEDEWYCLDSTWDAQSIAYEWFLKPYKYDETAEDYEEKKSFNYRHEEECRFYDYDMKSWENLAIKPYELSGYPIKPNEISLKVDLAATEGTLELRIGDSATVNVVTDPINATLHTFIVEIKEEKGEDEDDVLWYFYLDTNGAVAKEVQGDDNKPGATAAGADCPLEVSRTSPGIYKMTARNEMTGTLRVYLANDDDTIKKCNPDISSEVINLKIELAEAGKAADMKIYSGESELSTEVPKGETAEYAEYLHTGEDKQLEAKVYDSEGTEIEDPNVSWQSSDSSIVKVDSSTGLLTGISGGEVYITAETPGPEYEIQKKIYVECNGTKQPKAEPVDGTWNTKTKDILIYEEISTMTKENEEKFSGTLFYNTDEDETNTFSDKELYTSAEHNSLDASVTIEDTNKDGQTTLYAYIKYNDPTVGEEGAEYETNIATFCYNWENNVYNVTLISDTDGANLSIRNSDGDPQSAFFVSNTVTVEAVAPAGYVFDYWDEVLEGDTHKGAEFFVKDIEASKTTMTMPAGDVYIKAYFREDGDPTADSASYEQGSEGVPDIRCTLPLEDFTGVEVDGSLVDSSNYDTRSGSTILTFHKDYLNTLSVGQHLVVLLYNNDRKVNTSITISKIGNSGSSEESKPALCDHEYVWVEDVAATADSDATLFYKCKKCGHIDMRMTEANSAYLKFNQDSEKKIKEAATGATVTIDTTKWNSFYRSVMDTLASRSDVKLVINYTDAGNRHQITIPAGTKLTGFIDEKGYTGFKFLVSKGLETDYWADAMTGTIKT